MVNRILTWPAALFLGLAASTAGAQDAERFAPAVGTEFEFHSVTVTVTAGMPDVHSEAWGAARVISNDGVLSTRQTRVIRAKSDRPGLAVPPSEYSDDNYVTTLLFVPVETGSHPRTMGPMFDNVMTIKTDCDREAILSLLPLGRTPSVTADCVSTQTVGGKAFSPTSFRQRLSYEGQSKVSTPAGTFGVHHLGMTYETGGGLFEVHLQIDTESGAMVRYATSTISAGRETRTVAELTSVRRP